MSKTAPLVLALLAAPALWLLSCHRQIPPPVTPAPVTEAPPAPSAPSCTLTAEPAMVEQGKSVTLSWTTQSATQIVLEPGLGPQQAQGSTSVTPGGSTTYSLHISGPGGQTTCSARVTVSVPEQPAASVREENLGPGPAGVQSELKDAFFDYDKSDIRPDAAEALTSDAKLLNAHPNIQFVIEGYCDQRGSEEYNLGLGQRRADAARAFLANLGVSPDRMSTISYGKDRLICTEATEDCYQKNRRVHLRVK